MDTKIRYNSLKKDPIVTVRLETDSDMWIGLQDSDVCVEASSYETFYLGYNKEDSREDINYGQPYVIILKPGYGDMMSFTLDNPEDGYLPILWAGSGPTEVSDESGRITYTVHFSDEDRNTYSYAEMQLIKYGYDLPWFGVLTYYK